MELIDFEKTRSVLEEFAEAVAQRYKDNLVASGRPTQKEAQLIPSIRTEVILGERAWEVTMTLRDYWKYVEEGVQGDGNPQSPYRNPGWKAFPHILHWIDIKPVLPRPNGNKIPSQKSLAYLITRSIVQHGTQGSHDLKRAKEDVMESFKERIVDALQHDVGFYIRKVIVGT